MKLTLDLGQDIKDNKHGTLFWACYLAFATTSFIFIIRGQIIDEWAVHFGLNETQKGEILGAGIWPLAISIVLFSMVIDDIGYGKSMLFGFVCQVVSGIVILTARGYWGLYIGSFLVSLGNGSVQAVSDATVATMFKQNKTKWLNIFHSGWPVGMIVGGALGVLLDRIGLAWQWSIVLLFIPIVLYGLGMLGKCFPVHERVKAGISYKEMLRQSGAVGMLIVLLLVLGEICRVFSLSPPIAVVTAITLAIFYGLWIRGPGRPIFIILLLLMIPLSTTEISTNSWIIDLLKKELGPLGINSSWVLIYISMIMVILRFCAGPIVRMFSPLGLLTVSSVLAALGLVAFSQASGFSIFLAATLFGLGTTFLWPTMLGVTAELFPKGGALSLNMVTAVGQLSAGIIGAALLGLAQDVTIDRSLIAKAPDLHPQVIMQKQSVIGKYQTLDPEKIKSLSAEQRDMIEDIRSEARQSALLKEALLPAIMIISYILLMLHFKRRGGYRAVLLQQE